MIEECKFFIQTGETGNILFFGCSTHLYATYIDRSVADLTEFNQLAEAHTEKMKNHKHQWSDWDPYLFVRNAKRCVVCGMVAPKDWEEE